MTTKNRLKPFLQHDRTDCGPTCLRIIAHYYGKSYSAEYLRDLCKITSEGVTVSGIVEAAEELGLQTLVSKIDIETLKNRAPLPCIVHWKQRHFVVVYEFRKGKVKVSDPDFGLISYSEEEFLKSWGNFENKNGLVILLETTPDFYEKDSFQESKGISLLLPYLKTYRSYFFRIIVGLLVGSVIQITFPFFTQAIVDKGIRYEDVNFISIILIAQLSLYFFQAAINIFQGWLLLYLGGKINILLSSDFLKKMMTLPMSFFSSKIQGDVLQRVEDTVRIQKFLTSSPLSLIQVFNLFVFIFILLYYNTKIFLVYLLGATLYMLWFWFFMNKRKKLDYKRFDEAAGNSNSLLQIINGIQEIKINQSHRRRRWAWEDMRVRLFNIEMQSLKVGQIQTVGANTINQIANISITYIAAISVLNGQMTLGIMLAIQYIIGQLNLPLNIFSQFLKEKQDAELSLNRMKDVLTSNKTKITNYLGIPTGDILFNSLSFKYGGKKSKIILSNINLEIKEGEVTAIVGESGSGKTTLLKLILKLFEASSGNIKIGDQDLNDIETKEWLSKCGVVMQDGYIFTDTILNNITESNSESELNRENLAIAIKIANIGDMIKNLPAGLKTRIGPSGTSGVNLSGGQRQRILIARAIYRNPNYFFFDEATSALDANNENIIMNNLFNYFQNKTAIIIAHRLSTVKNANKIIVMKDGQIIESGKHDELILEKGIYYSLVKNQLELSK